MSMYFLCASRKMLVSASMQLRDSSFYIMDRSLSFSMAQQPLSGPGSPHYRGFTITLRHSTGCRTPLDEWSGRRRDETDRKHKRQTSMPPEGFEPSIPASERPQTHVLDRTATGIGLVKSKFSNFATFWPTDSGIKTTNIKKKTS